jgi:hypothetical protein
MTWVKGFISCPKNGTFAKSGAIEYEHRPAHGSYIPFGFRVAMIPAINLAISCGVILIPEYLPALEE